MTYPQNLAPTMQSEINGNPVPAGLRFHFIARCALLLHGVAVSAFAWLAPTSMTGRMLGVDAGFTPRVILLAMTVVTLLGVADAIINDLLPARWSLPCVQRNRHLGYISLGAIFVMQVFASSSDLPPGGGVLVAYHLGAGVLCALFAIAATLRPSHAL